MDYEGCIRIADRESEALAAAVGEADPASAIPSCDGWTVGELAVHTGEFLGFWCHVLCEATGRPKPEAGDAPAPADRDRWLGRLRADLLAELRTTAPDTPVWTWAAAPGTAAFVARRAAAELAIHRFDAEEALGHPRPLDRDTAVEVIDEIADLAADAGNDAFGRGETIHLHATDGDHEWLFRLDPDGFTWRHEHAKGDLAIRGAVSDLALVLYGRRPIGSVELLGDAAALDAWRVVWPFR